MIFYQFFDVFKNKSLLFWLFSGKNHNKLIENLWKMLEK